MSKLQTFKDNLKRSADKRATKLANEQVMLVERSWAKVPDQFERVMQPSATAIVEFQNALLLIGKKLLGDATLTMDQRVDYLQSKLDDHYFDLTHRSAISSNDDLTRHKPVVKLILPDKIKVCLGPITICTFE